MSGGRWHAWFCHPEDGEDGYGIPVEFEAPDRAAAHQAAADHARLEGLIYLELLTEVSEPIPA